MKIYILLLFSAITMLFSCNTADYDAILEQLRDHEERIQKLETLCNQLNSNIEAVQTILEAQEQNDYITDITKLTEAGIEIGYSITFAKGGTVNIYHGSNESDAPAPKISIRKASDGEYYWTADDEWLTDENGNKIPATVPDDPDGKYTTPHFRVAEGIWYISLDNGNTWQEIGTSIADRQLFIEVNQDNLYVYFTLNDGTIVKCPKYGNQSGRTEFGLITQFSDFLTRQGRCYSSVTASLITDKNYDTWIFETMEDGVIFMTEEQKSQHNYFSISVILPEQTKGKRYRYNGDEDTLPMEDSPLQIPAGSTVHITVRTDVPSWSVYSDIVTPGTDIAIMKAIEDNQLILQNITNSHTNQSLLILKKCGNSDELFMGQLFTRSTGSNNLDCWRLDKMSIYKRIDNTFMSYKGPIIMGGEWECAVHEVGVKDFIGGQAHGDETFTSIICMLDGKSLDLSSNFVATGRRLEIVRTSTLDRCDTPGDKVIDHLVKYLITPESITFDQTIEFQQEMTIKSSYLAMCPVGRAFTRWGCIEGQTEILDISEAGHSRFPVNGNHAHYTLWSDNFSIDIEYECHEGYFPCNYGFISPSSSPAYNKVYYNFVGNTEVTVPVGHRVSSSCKVSYNYNE